MVITVSHVSATISMLAALSLQVIWKTKLLMVQLDLLLILPQTNTVVPRVLDQPVLF